MAVMDHKRTLLGFAVSILMSTCCGILYAYALFSDQLRSALLYSQVEVSLIGAFGSSGVGFSGLFIGPLYDWAGVRVVATMAAVLLSGSYLLIWATVMGYVLNSAPLMMFYFCVAGVGSFAGYTAALATTVKNAPKKWRGAMVGIMASGFGLSSLVFTQIYAAMGPHATVGQFYLMAACVAFTAMSLGAIVLKVDPLPDAVSAPNKDETNISLINNDKQDEKSPALPKVPVTDVGNTPKEVLQTADFWILMAYMFIGVGAGLMYITNMGSMITSIMPNRTTAEVEAVKEFQVSLLSAANCLGRLISGALADFVCRRWRVPRAAFAVACMVIMTLAMYLNAFLSLNEHTIAASTFFSGYAYGMIFPVVITLLTELFGPKYLATNYGIATFFGAVSSPPINAMFGFIYQVHAGSSTATCYTSVCYATTYLIMGTACIGAGALAALLTLRMYRRMPRKIIE